MTGDAPTQPRKPVDVLKAARQRASRDKRAQVTRAIAALLSDNDPITFAKVARRAQVSTWLVYAPGVREQIDAAITRQDRRRTGDHVEDRGSTPQSLHTDLELARKEIRKLRHDRGALRAQMQALLGQQLTNLTTGPLVERINKLTGELTEARSANQALAARVEELEDELAGARAALRQMIKEASSAREATC
jgi:predicted RNase H-like nuclease (RuvC/YqgF family)